MRLFIAREALDPHLKIGGAIVNTQLLMSERAKAVVSSGKFYAGWYRVVVTERRGPDWNLHVTWKAMSLRGAHEQTTRAGLFHAMARVGPKLDREQLFARGLWAL